MGKSRVDDIIEYIDQKKSGEKGDIQIVKDFLIAELGDGSLAIQIEYLREVFDIQDKRDIAIIPFTPPYIKGIINVRNEIIPVLSFAEILKTAANEEDYRKMVIIEYKQTKIGFPIAGIIDLKTVEVSTIRKIKDVKKLAENTFINEEFAVGKLNVGILDIPVFFGSQFIS